jgi:hypothetical protein
MKARKQQIWGYIYSILCIICGGFFWINQGLLMSSCSGGGGYMSFSHRSEY